MEELADPACELYPQGTAQRAAHEGPYRGYAGVQEYFADVARVWDELRVDPGELRVAGDGVVSFGTAHGGTTDGHEVTAPVIWVFKLRAGRVLSVRVVATAAEAERELRSTA